ncbi:hypothetical protein NLJ89_g9727 [Agrocybe chaxingu]|uniref:Uncharacterized protein n=1 Tax=Agrocybe chaxingu TaxID=84603 RepID=A0A9W8JSP6_9AGAR|nr:hypothetical protein NLJ89_g9727 [Agrocybe chaxingu]
MKPELMWTKQHEAFLYFDTALKPRPGQGPGFRVKIPGHQTQVVRGPLRVAAQPSASASTPASGSGTATVGDNFFVVRLPKRSGKEKEVAAVETQVEDTATGKAPTVQPVTSRAASTSDSTKPIPTTGDEGTSSLPKQALPKPTIRSQLEQLSLEPQASDPERQAKTELAVLRKPPSEVVVEVQASVSPVAERPTLAPLQTTFTPPPPPPPPPQPISQPSPAYGSPYGYPLPLPPGISMNAHGMPYEVATGRPVYLQAPAMYNPRPIIPSHIAPVPFVPGHMHHHSSVSVTAVSPDFLAQPPSHTPPVNGFIDPATGTPIFSFPRQTTRIEIRAPADESSKPAKPMSHTASGLRTTAPTFQPTFTPAPVATARENGYYPSPPSDVTLPAYDNVSGHGGMEDGLQAGMPGMMGYHYQQPYYYPEPYGYAPYMDMSQGGQYDMYGMDQTPQGTVYYR